MAFPSSPSNGDLHTEYGRTFKYSSATNSWSVATPDAPADTLPSSQAYVDVASLPLSGVVAGSTAFVQDGNKLFMFSGNGWFEIATVNTAPTITTGADASYTLNSDGTPTVITLQATDPEGTPIVWGYQVTSGSLEDTTVTNVGGQFTITPGATEATFSLTFTASDGVNIDTSASSFTLSFIPDWANTTLLHTLDNPNAYGTSANDYFGRRVSISGNYAIVSADAEDDASGELSGKAYIFNVTTGALVHTLDNPNAYGTTASDEFGISAAISGNYAIVGAYYEDDATTGLQSGKAYIFNVTTGALVHTLNNPNPYGIGENDRFGWSVAISDNYAIVSAHYEDTASMNNSGIAYIFNVTTGTLVTSISNPNPDGTTTSDWFAYTVAISGNYAIVGAILQDDAGATDSGKAYIFNVTTGALVHTLNNPSPTTNDNFGLALAIDGNYAIVGNYLEGGTQSGKAYIFDVTTGALVHTLDNPNAYSSTSGDRFGYSVAISGNYAVVGAHAEDDIGGTESGKAYIFDVTTGTLLKTLDNPNAYGTSAADYFGESVSIDGNFVIVSSLREDDAGGTESGKAYIFKAG